MHAHSLGEHPPNTAAISFKLGKERYYFQLGSTLTHSGALKFRLSAIADAHIRHISLIFISTDPNHPLSPMKLATIILILLAFSSGGVSISAQTNLVPNSGFEECSGYPTEPGESALITGWFSPNPGAPQLPNPSPDFLHVDGKHQAKLPGTAFGSVYPYKGKAVAGFIAFNGYVSDFREYLSIKLKEPMQKGKKYRVSFYLTSGRPFNRSDYNVNLGTGEYIIQRKEGSTKQTIQKYRTYAYPYHTIEANQTSQHYGQTWRQWDRSLPHRQRRRTRRA